MCEHKNCLFYGLPSCGQRKAVMANCFYFGCKECHEREKQIKNCDMTKKQKKLHACCSHCNFWVPSPDTMSYYIDEEETPGMLKGGCHRFPPSSKGWFETSGFARCGEYLEKKDKSQIAFAL